MDLDLTTIALRSSALSNPFRRSLILYIQQWYPLGVTITQLAVDYERSDQYIAHNLGKLVEADLLIKNNVTKLYSNSPDLDHVKLFTALADFYSAYNTTSGGQYKLQPQAILERLSST